MKPGVVALALVLAAPAGAVKIDGALVEPSNLTTRDAIEITVVGSENFGCPIFWSSADVHPLGSGSFVVDLVGNIGPECPVPLGSDFGTTFKLPPQPAGEYRVQVSIQDPLLPPFLPPFVTVASWDEIFHVQEPDPQLAIGDEETFLATVEWSNPHNGSHGLGYARKLGDDSGAFWYFGSNNLETTLKILDGRPINGHWWVFIANMTDLEVKATVLYNQNDCLLLPVFPPDCPTKTYTQAAGAARNFIDVEAFTD